MSKNPVTLPLITSAPVFMASNPDLDGPDAPRTITVQMQSLGGDIYLLPLTVQSATDLLAIFALWEPAMEVVKSGKLPKPRKLDN